MKVFVQIMIISILMVMAAPAWSDSVVHIVSCEQDDDTSDEQVEALAASWLKAAKTVKGGENLELYLNFPVAAKAGEVDFLFVVIAPSFSEWGTFMDNYDGSAASKIDDDHVDDLDCGDGSLWESVTVN